MGSVQPFCSTLQLSRSFKLLNWFYKWRLWGYIFVWEKVLPQSHRATASATPALNRQSGNVRVAAPSAVVFNLPKQMCLLHRSLWSRVLALPPLSGPITLSASVADLPKIEESLRKMRQHFLGSSKERLGTIYRFEQKCATASQTLGFENVLGRWRPVFNRKALRKLRKQFLAYPIFSGGARAAVKKLLKKFNLLTLNTKSACAEHM